MSKYLIFNFLLVLFIVNCPISVSVSKDLTKNDPPKYNPTSTIFSKPSTGISFADQDINFKNIKFRLTITRVNLKKRSVRIVSSHSLALKNDSNSHLGGYNLSEYQKLTNSPLVLSGGYLSSWQPALPLGLVKVNGVQANRPHLSWLVDGLFCTNGKEVIIDKYSSIEQTRNWLDCLQAGPLLIKDGKIIKNAPKPYNPCVPGKAAKIMYEPNASLFFFKAPRAAQPPLEVPMALPTPDSPTINPIPIAAIIKPNSIFSSFYTS